MTQRLGSGQRLLSPHRSRMRFAAEVSTMRAFQGWTVEQLIAALPSGWTAEQIREIEQGETYPRPKIREVVLRVLGSSWGSGDGRRRRWSS
jgi:hypothetical protein